MAKPDDYAIQDPADLAKINSLIHDLSDPHGLKRQEARLNLVAIGKPAVPALVESLEDPREGVRWEAAKTLSQIGDPAAAPRLVKALEDENFSVRWLAAEGLIATGRQGLTLLLQTLVKHSDSKWLRDGAHHVIRTLVGTPDLHEILAPVLAALEDIEPVIEVPPAAQAALISLTNTVSAHS